MLYNLLFSFPAQYPEWCGTFQYKNIPASGNNKHEWVGRPRSLFGCKFGFVNAENLAYACKTCVELNPTGHQKKPWYKNSAPILNYLLNHKIKLFRYNNLRLSTLCCILSMKARILAKKTANLL